MQNFKDLTEQLYKQTLEEILEEYKATSVECNENRVYEDEDLYTFLNELGAEIVDRGAGYILIQTKDEKYYEVPYKEFKNRFGDDLPDETIIFFEPDRIYDVTDNYAE